MKEIKSFLGSFEGYVTSTDFSSFQFYLWPLGTLGAIWLLALLAIKYLRPRDKRFKTIFAIYRGGIFSSLVVAMGLVSFLCWGWATHFFSHYPLEFSALLSLILALAVPAVLLLRLRSFYSIEQMKEVIEPPKTANQREATEVALKRAFWRLKPFYFIPFVGLLFLLLQFRTDTNLITIVYDNSSSMEGRRQDAIKALTATFDNLQENNEVIITTLDGPGNNMQTPPQSLKALMSIDQSSKIRVGNIKSYPSPATAVSGLSQLTENMSYGSPIAASIWKTFLHIQENHSGGQAYEKRLLIVFTDGADDMDSSLLGGKFFFDDERFKSTFPPEHVYIINFDPDEGIYPLTKRFEDEDCTIYPAANEAAFQEALDDALRTFKSKWNLVAWVCSILVLFTVVGLAIGPKKIL